MLELVSARVSLDGTDVLCGASLVLHSGEILALSGANGAGKSTLARLCSAALLATPGTVRLDGLDPTLNASARYQVRNAVGVVQQDPADQLVSSLVLDEVAFGPRNLGLSEREIWPRCRRALELVGLSSFLSRDVASLSGGEMVRLALASVLAMQPRYLILDEVSCMLDPIQRASLYSLVMNLAREEQVGILLITHDAHEINSADRALFLQGGKLLSARACQYVKGSTTSHSSASSLSARCATSHTDHSARSLSTRLCLKRVSFSYQEQLKASSVPSIPVYPALQEVSLELCAGEVLLLAGPSGSGKSTLAYLAAGLMRPDTGSVQLDGQDVVPGQVGLVFQRPEDQLFLETVFDDVAFGPRNLSCIDSEVEARVYRSARESNFDRALLSRAPFSLSGGHRRRAGIAGVLALDSPVLFLDEPTAMLDSAGRYALHTLVRAKAESGVAVVVISHDIEEWLAHADRVAFIQAGHLVWERPIAQDEFFYNWKDWFAKDQKFDNIDTSVCSQKASGSMGEENEEHISCACSAEFPYQSRSTLDARVKVILFLALVLVLFVVSSPWVLLAAFLLFAALCIILHVSIQEWLSVFKPVALICAFVLFSNLVVLDGSGELSAFAGIGLNLTRASYALFAAVRIMVLLGFSLLLARSTTPPEICDACVRLLRPSERLGVPVGAMGAALSISLRFMPLAAKEFAHLRLAQRARAAKFDTGSLTERIEAHVAILTPLIVALFRRAHHVSEAMMARSYRIDARTIPRRPLRSLEWCILISGGMVCALLIVFCR